MKIAHLLPYTARFPLDKHNGRYEWALRLAEHQAVGGHHVSVYSSPASLGSNNILWASSNTDLGDKSMNNQALIKTALDHDHDIYHSHFDYLHYLLADSTNKPIVSTQHWFPNQQIAAAARLNKNQNVIAVPSSKLMSAENKKLNIRSANIIRQGIDLDLFKPSSDLPTDRLVFVGRIAPWKGVLEAVEIAKKANVKLDIIGKLKASEKLYWEQIQPLIDGQQISYLGPKSQPDTARYMSEAKAFLFPSQAPEAAPQTPIEAQACGTPVIISDVGAATEWIDAGKSGFVARSEAQYIEAIKSIEDIDRGYCRRFAQQFDLQTMIGHYEKLYQELIKQRA